MDKKIITRAERQRMMDERNKKLDNHINKGVEAYVQSTYNDSKEARKEARWYQTGEALKEAQLQGEYDADLEFNEEFNEWAVKEQERFYAQLDAKEQKLLEAEDDILDVEYKEISLPSSRRTSKLLGSKGGSSTRLLKGSTRELEGNNKESVFNNNTLPPLD